MLNRDIVKLPAFALMSPLSLFTKLCSAFVFVSKRPVRRQSQMLVSALMSLHLYLLRMASPSSQALRHTQRLRHSTCLVSDCQTLPLHVR